MSSEDESEAADDGEENLNESDQERIDRVRGKRDNRRSRRDTGTANETQEQQVEHMEQEQQSKQAPQGQQAKQDSGGGGSADVAEQAQQTQQPKQEKQAPQAQQAKQEKLEPVTQREHDTFYLSKELRTELNKRYRRMSLDLLEETGVDIDDQRVGGQNRYFRPLALLLGARQIEEMSSSELRETIEQEELIDDLPAEE